MAAKEFLHNIGSDEMMTGALWFIGLLAIAMIILPILLTYDRGKSKRMVLVVFLLTLISYLCDTTRHMSHFPILPFRLRSLSAVVMYLYLGHILKKPIARMIYCSFKFKIIFFVAFPLFFVLACMNQTVNIAVPVYHDLLIYIYCSLYGTIFVLLISCHRLPVFIEYIGRQSLFFFAVHAIWITVFVKIVNTYFGTSFKPMIDLPSYMIGVGGVVVVIMSAVTTFFVLPVYKKINEFIYSYLNM